MQFNGPAFLQLQILKGKKKWEQNLNTESLLAWHA